MMNTISGKIIAILDPMVGDSKTNPGTKWMRQEFVLETQEAYPRKVCFNIWGEDRIRQANINMDDSVTIEFELTSREYNGRWYTNVEARNVMKTSNTSMQNFQAEMPNTNNQFGGNNSTEDNLPF